MNQRTHNAINELGQSLWIWASWDVVDQFCYRDEAVASSIFGDTTHFLRRGEWFGNLSATTKWTWWDNVWSLIHASFCVKSTQCMIEHRWGTGGVRRMLNRSNEHSLSPCSFNKIQTLYFWHDWVRGMMDWCPNHFKIGTHQRSMYQWWVSMLGVHGGCIDCSKMRQYCYFYASYSHSIVAISLFLRMFMWLCNANNCYGHWGICDNAWTMKQQISLVCIAQFTSETTMSKYCDGVRYWPHPSL